MFICTEYALRRMIQYDTRLMGCVQLAWRSKTGAGLLKSVASLPTPFEPLAVSSMCVCLCACVCTCVCACVCVCARVRVFMCVHMHVFGYWTYCKSQVQDSICPAQSNNTRSLVDAQAVCLPRHLSGRVFVNV